MGLGSRELTIANAEDEVEEVAHRQEEEGRLLPHRHHLPHHLSHRLPGVQHNLLVLLQFTFQQR